jgi:transcriptional regulator with XRE-family HTH domain
VGRVEGDLQRRLGQNLRRLRKAKGLSQEAFADTLHINRTYIGGLERGERNVTLRTVERIALSLGVDPADLLAEHPSAGYRDGGPPF